MNTKIIDPFVDAVSNILPQVGLNDIKKSEVKVKDRNLKSPGVVIILGIVGDVKGTVVYGMKIDDAKKIASKMMMGMPVNEFDEMAKSAISELSNMITANASIKFCNEGIDTNISTPTLICGEQSEINMSYEEVICVELEADNIPFEVNVCFK
ncbi:chemotaxis protein CheX [Haloimpatiens sp. FM7330]|uniref:chemotaxis protein CheX n=1 Tax=Haloimpatiens sp. FM7330 TaxID=3298610 RepID=UPI00363F2ABD